MALPNHTLISLTLILLFGHSLTSHELAVEIPNIFICTRGTHHSVLISTIIYYILLVFGHDTALQPLLAMLQSEAIEICTTQVPIFQDNPYSGHRYESPTFGFRVLGKASEILPIATAHSAGSACDVGHEVIMLDQLNDSSEMQGFIRTHQAMGLDMSHHLLLILRPSVVDQTWQSSHLGCDLPLSGVGQPVEVGLVDMAELDSFLAALEPAGNQTGGPINAEPSQGQISALAAGSTGPTSIAPVQSPSSISNSAGCVSTSDDTPPIAGMICSTVYILTLLIMHRIRSSSRSSPEGLWHFRSDYKSSVPQEEQTGSCEINSQPLCPVRLIRAVRV